MPQPLVLCADDSAAILQAWKTLLEREGCKVLTASDGQDALEIFLSENVDLVLLDYHMQQMNGDVAAARMRAHNPEIPIALLSADPCVPEDALGSVDAFICKAEAASTLLEIVGHLLRLRYLFQPLNGLQSRRSRKAA